MLLADEHRFDLLASAGKRPADSCTNVDCFRALGVNRRSLLAGLVVLTGLALAWPQAQPARAVAQPGGSITPDKIAQPVATPPEGRTGIIVPATAAVDLLVSAAGRSSAGANGVVLHCSGNDLYVCATSERRAGRELA